MTKLNPIKPEKLARVIRQLGYKLDYVHGSHHYFINHSGKRITIPIHFGREIGRGLLLKIIKEDLGITVEEFQKLR